MTRFSDFIRLLSWCALIGCPLNAYAQAGVSGMTFQAARAGLAMRADEIKIAELINYHRHQIPLPTGNERLHLDIQAIAAGHQTAFQIGLAAPRELDPESARPLNLVLVVDRSGSMSGTRLGRVKQALHAFVARLRPIDRVAIVTYADRAIVHLPASAPTRVAELVESIDRIQAGGKTNLHDGLMLGFEQARLHFDPERANRVILLTDGLANVGTVEPDEIARASGKQTRQGMDLTTIGLGDNFQRELLRELAEAGRGAVHFVSDAEDIQKVFVDEIDSLLFPAAREIRVALSGPGGGSVHRLFGYPARNFRRGPTWTVPLENMSQAATQVIVGLTEGELSEAPLEVCLEYTDAVSGETIRRWATLGGDAPLPATHSIERNLAIAKLAAAWKRSARQWEANHRPAARRTLQTALRQLATHFPDGQDPDVDRVRNLVTSLTRELCAAEGDDP